MPTFRSLSVRITNQHDAPLQEWGTRSSERGKNASCYVQSANNMPFRISIKPSELPWPEYEREWEERKGERVRRSQALRRELVGERYGEESEGEGEDGGAEGEEEGGGVMRGAAEMFGLVKEGPDDEDADTDDDSDVDEGAGARGDHRDLSPMYDGVWDEGDGMAAKYEEFQRNKDRAEGIKSKASPLDEEMDDENAYAGNAVGLKALAAGSGAARNAAKMYESIPDMLAKTGRPKRGPYVSNEQHIQAEQQAQVDRRRMLQQYDRGHRHPGFNEDEEWLDDMERLHADTAGFLRPMDIGDIKSKDLKRRIHRAAWKQLDRTYEALVLETAEYDQDLKTQALQCLEDFADRFYRGTRSLGSGQRAGNTEPAPYHLLATLRLDGKRGWEKRTVIYLDSRHPSFKLPDGETKMTSRTVRGEDGELHDCGWFFSEVGIETVMDNLSLSMNGIPGAEAVPAEDEDDLTSAFNKLGGNHLDDEEEKVAAGQIEITFDRVTVGALKKDVAYRQEDGADRDVDMTSPDMTKVSHIAARDSGTRRKATHDVIYYDPYVKGEPAFATFRFYYRSADKLRAFGFKGYDPSAVSLPYKKDRLLRNTAPLSVTKPAPPQYLFDAEGNIITEVDAPKSRKFGDAKSADELQKDEETETSEWKPSNSTSRALDNLASLLNQPGSPSNSPVDSGAESEDEEIKTGKAPAATGSKSTIKPVFKLSNFEAEQSSADESSPLKPASKQSSSHMTKFRMMDDSIAEDEEADDEASLGYRTPTSTRADDGSAWSGGDDNGVAQNKNDEGIGKRLAKIGLGKRGAEVEVGEEKEGSLDGKAKKARREEKQGQQSDQQIDGVGAAHATELAVAYAGVEEEL